MIIKYRVPQYSNKVEKKEFIRETDKFLIHQVKGWGIDDIEERREAKISEYSRYFDSEREALTFIIERNKKRLESLKRETNEVNSGIHQLEKQLRELTT